MNAPYNKNLHLKILQEAMKHSDDIVNLSPIRWLQDPLAEYKKNSDWKKFEDVRKRIESLEPLDAAKTNAMFGIQMGQLGIYHLTENGGWEREIDPLVEKVVNKCLEIAGLPAETYTGQKNAVVIKQMTNPNRSTAYNLCSRAVGYKNVNSLDDKKQMCICFKTSEEADNFRKSTETKMYKYCVKHILTNENVVCCYKFLPFMPTYTHPWTDEMLYEYFGLTEDEIKEIENEIDVLLK